MRALLLFLALLLAPPAAVGQASDDPTPRLRLLIEVFDAESGEPLPGAHVGADSTIRVTNVDGRVLFRGIAPGAVTIAAAFVGYAAVDTTLSLERSARLAFMLQPEAQALARVDVEGERFNTARLERIGFYDRRDGRSGTFLTSEDLEQRGAVAFSDVFRGVAGLRIQMGYGSAYLTSTRRRNCSPAIFLDGQRAQYLEESLDSVSLRDVLAVEIYRGPSEVPIEYSASINGTFCGAVLVWTRAR